MKTTWRKLLVLMLSVTMVLSYAVPSFALTDGEPAEETEETETAEPAEEAEETEAAEPMEETEAPVLKAASESSVTYSVSIEDPYKTVLAGQTVERKLTVQYWSEEAGGWVQGLREGDILEIALHEPINGVDLIQNDESITISVAADAALPETAEVLMNGLSLMLDVNIQSEGEYIYQHAHIGAVLKPYEYDLRYLIGGEAAEDDNCYAMAGSTLVIQPALYKVTANGEEQVTEGVTWQAADGSDVTDNGDGTWSHVKPDTGGNSYSIAILPQFNAPDGNSMSVNQYLWIMEPKYVQIQRDGDWDIWSDDTDYVVYMDPQGQEISYDQIQWVVTLERDGEVIGTAPETCYYAFEEDGVSKVRIDATAIDGWKALENDDVLCIEVRLLKNGTVVAGNIAGAAGQAFRTNVRLAYIAWYRHNIDLLVGQSEGMTTIDGAAFNKTSQGNSVYFAIAGIEIEDTAIASATENGNGEWELSGISKGKTTAVIRYASQDDPETVIGSLELPVTVSDYIYLNSTDFNIEEKGEWRNWFPTGTEKTLTAELEYVYADPEDPTQRHYADGLAPGHRAVWSVDAPDGYEEYLTLTPSEDGLSCTISLDKDAPEGDNYEVFLTIQDGDGMEMAKNSRWTNTFAHTATEGALMKGEEVLDLDTRLKWGEEITVRPAIRRIDNGVVTEVEYSSCELTSDLSGTAVRATDNGDGTWTVGLVQVEGVSANDLLQFNLRQDEYTAYDPYTYIVNMDCDSHDWKVTITEEPQGDAVGSAVAECEICGRPSHEVSLSKANIAAPEKTDAALLQFMGVCFGGSYFTADETPAAGGSFYMTRYFGGFQTDQAEMVYAKYSDFVNAEKALFADPADLTEQLETEVYGNGSDFWLRGYLNEEDDIVFIGQGGFGTDEQIVYDRTADSADGGKVIYGHWEDGDGTVGSNVALTLDAQGRITAYETVVMPIDSFRGAMNSNGFQFNWTKTAAGADHMQLHYQLFHDGEAVDNSERWLHTDSTATVQTVFWDDMLDEVVRQYGSEGEFSIKADLIAYSDYDESTVVARSESVEIAFTLTGIESLSRDIDEEITEDDRLIYINENERIDVSTYYARAKVGIKELGSAVWCSYLDNVEVTGITLGKGDSSNFSVKLEDEGEYYAHYLIAPKSVSKDYLGEDDVTVTYTQDGAQKSKTFHLVVVDEGYNWSISHTTPHYNRWDNIQMVPGDLFDVEIEVHKCAYNYEDGAMKRATLDVTDQVEVVWKTENCLEITDQTNRTATAKAIAPEGEENFVFAAGTIYAEIKADGLTFRKTDGRIYTEITPALWAPRPIVTYNGDGTFDFDTEVYRYDADGGAKVTAPERLMSMLSSPLTATAGGNTIDAGNSYTGPLTVSGIEVGDFWSLNYSAYYTADDGREKQTQAISFSVSNAGMSPTLWAPIQMDKSAATLKVGSSEQRTVQYVNPDQESWLGAPTGVSFSSSDESVATVDQNGNVTAVKPGTAVITAEYERTHTRFRALCTITVEPEATIEAPTITEIKNVSAGTKVTWSPVEGADHYLIGICESDAEEMDILDEEITGTSYTMSKDYLESGVEYAYSVIAVSGGEESELSEEAYCIYLEAPTITKTRNVNAGIEVTWGKVTGADSYIVMYKTGSGSWKEYADDVTATKYVVKKADLKSGTKYQFTIKAVEDETGDTSGYTSGKAQTYMTTPAVTKTRNVNAGIEVTWGKVTGATNYIIMYKKDGASWTTLTTVGDVTKYVVPKAKLSSGTKYWITVKAKGAATSGYSGGKAQTYMTTPVVKSATKTSSGVKVTWGKVTGATSYTVMMKVSGGSWTTVKSGVTGTSYTVPKSKLTSGKTYSFTVKAKGAATSGYSSGKSLTYKA